jgi:hypothetical protein
MRLILLILLSSAVILGGSTPVLAQAPSDPAKDPTAKSRSGAPAAEKPASKSATKYKTETLRGKVVWLAEALRRRYGLRLDADAEQSLVALETPQGELIPIMKTDRGRGFWKDERLRGIDMELFVRRYEGTPLVQVIRVYTVKNGKKYELDYWCDVCAIPMFELKACECCQGTIRIRERLVEENK